MTWFADLAPCGYFGAPKVTRAVGWLERGHEFAMGATPLAVYERLRELFVDAFQPVALGGAHVCGVCQFDGASGALNLWVAGDGFLYVCPELILHYIGAHSYRPPAEFQEAVLRCPDTHTTHYKREFLANGGRELMKALREADAPGRDAGLRRGDG